MKSSYHIRFAVSAFVIAALACNINVNQPVEQPNLAYTAAAQTVAAQLTSLVPLSSPTSAGQPLPAPSNTVPAPTFAPLPTPTFLPTVTQQCDRAVFVADVTVPDGTVMAQGQVFIKTWRIKNIGACSWTPAYSVVFFSGDSLNGPAVQALTGNVDPGQTVDVSVNLKAPGSNGSYTGYWKIRNASGVTFTQFYVQIAVQGGAGETTVALNHIPAESGQVRSDGTVILPTNTGDANSNDILEAFFSYDISSIPNSATILSVLVNFTSFDMLGNPFSLGDNCVRAYVDPYGLLDFSDYFGGDPLGAVAKWCSAAQLASPYYSDNIASAIQSAISGPESRFQLRLQFRQPTTNNDFVADAIRWGPTSLTITYQP